MTNQLIKEKALETWRKIYHELEKSGVVFPIKFKSVGGAYGSAVILKTSLNEVVEATKKEWEEKYRKYRNSCLDELEGLGYNKDAIKRREKEILEGIEKLFNEEGDIDFIKKEIKKIINKV